MGQHCRSCCRGDVAGAVAPWIASVAADRIGVPVPTWCRIVLVLSHLGVYLFHVLINQTQITHINVEVSGDRNDLYLFLFIMTILHILLIIVLL